jgi:hypothetical protein
MTPQEIAAEIRKNQRELDNELARIKGRNAATTLIKWAKIFLIWYGVYSLIRLLF